MALPSDIPCALQPLQISPLGITDRELIYNQSQRIAKIGSWEYQTKNGLHYWSDEMYNIFGLDSNFDLHVDLLSDILFEESRIRLVEVTKNLLHSGDTYDLTVQARTPLGYTKWVRIYAFPVLENNVIVGARGICHDVTYYKEAEERLSVSENKYRSLFEQASDAILVVDTEGHLIEVNSRLCRMLGFSREELLAMNIAALVGPTQRDELLIDCGRQIWDDNIFKKGQLLHKNKTPVEIEATVKKFDNNRVMAIVRDVTELRKAQRQIQISEARFRSAFEFSAIGMALVSLEGKFMKVNRQLCKIVGYSHHELLNTHAWNLTHPEDRYKDREFIDLIARGETEAYKSERRYMHKSGKIVWINLSVSAVREDEGPPLYFVSQIEDITERKSAQEKLINSQANLNATINNTEIHIWSVDRDFNLLTFNRPFARYMARRYGVFLVNGEGAFGQANHEMDEALREKWNVRYLRALSGEIVSLEESNEEDTFQYSLSPIIEGEKVTGVTVIGEDITERKERARELADANKKIAELKLMALRSVMNPHFIFNALSSIQFFIARNDKVNAIQYLSTFSRLIRSILTHSVSNTISLTDEIDMLKHYIQLEMTRFEGRFDFIFNIEPGLDTDAVRIPSLLIQPYVENAILHGLYNKRSKGKLMISIRREERSVIFEIEDNGVGREEAMKLKRRNAPGHNSLGSKLTEERLKLISEQSRALLSIVDLREGGLPGGTRVVICIPLENSKSQS